MIRKQMKNELILEINKLLLLHLVCVPYYFTYVKKSLCKLVEAH
jgi:hypothetical protein